jgi:hypothetical protein
MQWDVCKKVFADVREVEATDVKTSSVLGISQRTLTIRTEGGEAFDLVLQADTPEKLEFKKPEEPGWLTPKVYKGKSMHEEELEHQS